MKISRDRLVQIIKEELNNVTEGQSDMLNHPAFLDPENHWYRKKTQTDPVQQGQLQDDPEEAMMNQRAAERIQEIDAEIARLQAEKESLMVNINSSMVTQNQIMTRGSDD